MGFPAYFLGALLVTLTSGNSPYTSTVRSPLCTRSDASCDIDGSCTMRYIPGNSSVCGALPFQNILTPIGQLSLGYVRLETYLYVDQIYDQTAFNITFYDLSWTHMQFRISLNGNFGRNTCREFIRTSTSKTTQLSYDCLWSDERYEGKPFVLEYEARLGDLTETARVSFAVPFAAGTNPKVAPEQWQTFVYVESLPSQLGRTTFNVHWSPAPTHLKVRSYRLFAFSDNEKDSSVLLDEVSQCHAQQCLYTTSRWFGTARFGVQPIYENGLEGYISKTPAFDLGGDSTRPLLVGIVSCSVILPVIVYLFVLLRNYIVHRSSKVAPPKMLLVYNPTTTPHLHMVEALANYLNTHCNVIAKMDELDIPHSPAKDPFIWCNEAILSADIVVVIASPYHKYLRTSAALYRTDRLLLRLLRERYAAGGKTRYCVLLPSYTTSADIPFEALSLRRYSLPDELNMLLHHTRFRWPLPYCLAKGMTVRPDFTELGRELIDSLAAAASDLKEHHSEYLTQVQEASEKTDIYCDVGISKPSKTQGFLTSWNPFEKKKVQIYMAEETFSAFPGNIDTLNLLGETELSPVAEPTQKVGEFLDLDQLNL